MDITKAWKRDAGGWFLEMGVGTQKRYSIDWTKFLAEIPGDALASVLWTIPVGLTKLSQVEVGNVAQIELSAPTKGTYLCSHKMTSVHPVIEIVPFRVIVD